MRLFKKINDYLGIPDRIPDDNPEPGTPNDFLNDRKRLLEHLKRDGVPVSQLSWKTSNLYLHLYREAEWACGRHIPLPYPIELEPPHKFFSMSHADNRPPAIYPRRRPKRVAENLSCFTIAMSSSDSITASQAQQFWLSLKDVSEPVSFEIVASCEEIIFQFLCAKRDRNYIARQLTSYCPEAEINSEGDDPDYLLEWYSRFSEQSKVDYFSCHPCELGLSFPYYMPVRTFTNFDPDPLSVLVNAMGDLEEDGWVVFQALILQAQSDWQSGLLATFNDHWLGILDFIGREPIQMVKEKLNSYPFFAIAPRLMAFGDCGESLLALLEEMIESFRQYASQENHLYPLNTKDYPDSSDSFWSATLMNDILNRQTRRAGLLLNTRELSGLCHFPARSLQHPKLFRATHSIVKAPKIALQQGLTIGINEIHGRRKEVSIPQDHRDLHTYIVGATGTGKSTLLLNMIAQDMENGEGVGVIDPHGDLIADILPRIPSRRVNDVILFDPGDIEYPMGLNLLSASNFRETGLVCSDLLAVFQRMFDAASWGENIEQIMRMCILSLLEAGGYTLRDIRRLITNDVFRSEMVSKLSDPDLVEFWAVEFPGYSKATIGAVQRRLSRVLFTPMVRNILSQKESKLDFLEVMDSKKILLCNLSKGNIGQDNSNLFGQLLVSKIQISSMARASRPREQRQPFYLYVDEFQNFVTSSFEEILSEARKYQLCLILANQFTRQLSRRIHDAVFGNVGTLITFRLGLDDAQDLQRQLGKFTYENILNLGPYHTYVKMGRAQDSFSMVTLPPPEQRDATIAQRVKEASRQKYATAKAEVEAYLRGQTQVPLAPKPEEAEEGEKRADELEFFEQE